MRRVIGRTTLIELGVVSLLERYTGGRVLRRSDGRNVGGLGATAFVVVLLIVAMAGVAGADPSSAHGRPTARSTRAGTPGGIANINHVVVLMQENRSFD